MEGRKIAKQIFIVGVVFPAVSITLSLFFLNFEYEAYAPEPPGSENNFYFYWEKDYLDNASVDDPNATPHDQRGYYQWDLIEEEKWAPENIGVAVYWSLTTMTTVGYGDISPTTPSGRWVTIVQFIVGIVLFGYIASLIASVLVEANFREMFGMNKCKFSGHIVISAWNQIAEVVVKEILEAGRKVAVITESKDEIGTIMRLGDRKNIAVIHGDITNEETLELARVDHASTFIACSKDDSINLISTIHARSMNPDLRIIAQVAREELKNTMRVAGVSYISSPYEMTGSLMASAAFEPEVVNVIEEVSTSSMGFDVRQYTVNETAPIANKKYGEVLKLMRKNTNVIVLGVAKPPQTGEEYIIKLNPPDHLMVKPNDIILIIGDEESGLRTGVYLNTQQGR